MVLLVISWASSGMADWHTTRQLTLARMASMITSGWWPQTSIVFGVNCSASSPLAGSAMVTRPDMLLVGVPASRMMLPSSALTRLNTGMSSTSGFSTERMSWAAMVLVDSMPNSVPSSSTTGSATMFSSLRSICQA